MCMKVCYRVKWRGTHTTGMGSPPNNPSDFGIVEGEAYSIGRLEVDAFASRVWVTRDFRGHAGPFNTVDFDDVKEPDHA